VKAQVIHTKEGEAPCAACGDFHPGALPPWGERLCRGLALRSAALEAEAAAHLETKAALARARARLRGQYVPPEKKEGGRMTWRAIWCVLVGAHVWKKMERHYQGRRRDPQGRRQDRGYVIIWEECVHCRSERRHVAREEPWP
jgi:hypothetical protein